MWQAPPPKTTGLVPGIPAAAASPAVAAVAAPSASSADVTAAGGVGATSQTGAVSQTVLEELRQALDMVSHAWQAREHMTHRAANDMESPTNGAVGAWKCDHDCRANEGG